MTAPTPTVCRTCEGYGVIVHSLNSDVQQLRPCPGCRRCVVCGQLSGGAAECARCAIDDETKAKRRADR